MRPSSATFSRRKASGLANPERRQQTRRRQPTFIVGGVRGVHHAGIQLARPTVYGHRLGPEHRPAHYAGTQPGASQRVARAHLPGTGAPRRGLLRRLPNPSPKGRRRSSSSACWRLGAFFGTLALLLAAVDSTAVAYGTARRPADRLAHRPRRPRTQVVWMILRDSLFLVALGPAIGLLRPGRRLPESVLDNPLTRSALRLSPFRCHRRSSRVPPRAPRFRSIRARFSATIDRGQGRCGPLFLFQDGGERVNTFASRVLHLGLLVRVSAIDLNWRDAFRSEEVAALAIASSGMRAASREARGCA